MQTYNHTQKGKHRWLVAAPLFAVCVVVSMSDVFFPVTAAVVSSATYKTDGATVLETTSGALLREGTVTVSSEEWTTLTVGDFVLSGWNGSFQVTLQQGVVTVAALTTPVHVSDGMRSTLVPAFMQWKGASLAASGTTLQSWYAPRMVQPLPAFFVTEALRSLPPSTGINPLVLPSFVSASDHFLVAAFHPRTRDHARVLSAPVLNEDESRLLLVLTPVSDTLSDGLDALALRQWQDRWMQTVETKEGVTLFADALPLLAAQLTRFDALQYPQRVEVYSTAILTIADPIERNLTADARKLLQDIRALRTERRLSSPIPDPVIVAPSSVAASSSSAKRVEVSADILVEQAAFAFANAGFMSTSQTILKPVGNIVEVSEIVFGTAKGDTLLRFSYDPQMDLVSAIHHEGQILPYAISLARFTEWLKGE